MKSENTQSEGIIVFALIIFGPLIFSFVVYLFKRSLFKLFFLISSLLIIVFFSVEYFLPANYEKEFAPESHVAIDYFKKKSGFFTSYKSIVVSFDYPDSISKTGHHIVKNFYRTGKEGAENYYVGKLLLDNNYKVIKVFYNQKAVTDMSLVQNEFGKTFAQMLFIKYSNALK